MLMLAIFLRRLSWMCFCISLLTLKSYEYIIRISILNNKNTTTCNTHDTITQPLTIKGKTTQDTIGETLHGWLAFLTGILTVIGALLLYAAVAGLTYGGFTTQMMVAIAVVLFAIAVIVAWLAYTGVRAQYLQVKTGKEALIGAIGVAVTDLKPKGEVRVGGEFWQALSADRALIANGESIKVLTMEGMFLIVTRAEEKA